jgi:hypothetical protein
MSRVVTQGAKNKKVKFEREFERESDRATSSGKKNTTQVINFYVSDEKDQGSEASSDSDMRYAA